MLKVDSEKHLRLVTAGYWISILALSINSIALIIEGDLPNSPTNFMVPVFFIIFFFSYLGMGKLHKDERLSKIAGWAMTISWCLTLLSAYALITLKSASYINLNAIQVLGVVLIVMVVSMAVSNEYWKRKGDIEG